MEIFEFSLGAGGGFFRGGMEGRIANGEGERFSGTNDIREKRAGRRLVPELQTGGERGIGGGQLACPVYGDIVDVGSERAPAEECAREKRIDGTGAGPQIEDAEIGAAGDGGVCGISREQIGSVMKVVGATGNRRAEKPWRKVPVGDTVVEFQQSAVERENCRRVGKIHGIAGERVGLDELPERGQGRDQTREVVGRAVEVARVEFAGRVVFDLGRLRFQ